MTEQQSTSVTRKRKHRRLIAVGVALLIIALLFIVILILSLTLFRPKQPKTRILSATVEGVSPRVSIPSFRIQLNITLNLQIFVDNPNYSSFKNGLGTTLLYYRNNQIGEANLAPGLMPARKSSTLPCTLNLRTDDVASDVVPLIRDVMSGEIVVQTRTRIPGRVTFLGVFKKHVVSSSECEITIGVPSMEVKENQCKSKTKL